MLLFFKKYEFLVFSIFYWLTSLFILANCNGTGGEADSINHYLLAKYAFQHPEILLNHWAKPLFTLMSAPFAQFGFIGMKFFNILCVYGASFFMYQIAKRLSLKFPIIAPLFYFLFPISFTTTFSGFTEPMCALTLSFSIFLFQRKKYLSTAILVSFLPFIRSEGLLFIGVFGLFFLHQKSWKAVALLGLGHVFYSIVGYFHFQDLLWVFTKIPYAHLSSHYGSGTIFHFAEKLNYLLGIPLLIFFVLGILRAVSFFRSSQPSIKLISLLFLIFFIAHSLFWYLEIFNSMGLKRVFAGVSPLMALLCLYGFDLLNKIDHLVIKRISISIVLVVTLIFPFTSNPAAVDWDDLDRTIAQQNASNVTEYIQSNSIQFDRLVYTDPYLCELLKVDPYDFKKSQLLASKKRIIPISELIVIRNYRFEYVPPSPLAKKKILFPTLQENDLVIWDSWHSVIDYGVQEEDLAHLELTKEFKFEGSTYKVYLYHSETNL
ncbi:MAG: hypothetical protein JKY48_05655 [Flavobacteriales bacterium]|nr:hypothetical protein [Flavobacteriales bacterium]